MKYTTVNGKNYFNEKSLDEMIERLENGEAISIYIDCIGHTRRHFYPVHNHRGTMRREKR